jgi:hypothetical protein
MRATGFSTVVGRFAGQATCAALVAITLLSGGCAASGLRGEIPLGQWSGEGVFVYEEWGPGGEQGGTPGRHSIHRSYPTSLSIRPGVLEGSEIIEMEIRSLRGALPDLGDETHLKVALVKARRVSDSTVLYRPVGLASNFEPGSGDELSLSFDDESPPFGASCITIDGATVLQIHYMDKFADTIRFQGDRVEKCGVYYDADQGLVHWCEHLLRRK